MHPKVREKYEREAPDLLENRLERAEEVNENNFWLQVKTSGQPVKREIVQIVRIKVNGKEYFYYGEELRSKNYLGNQIAHYHTVGKYEEPIFRFQINVDTNGAQKQTAEIESHETVYELNWPSDFTPELENLVNEKVDLIIKQLNRKYGGFNYDDFKQKSFDSLVNYGKYGTFEKPVIGANVRTRNAKPVI